MSTLAQETLLQAQKLTKDIVLIYNVLKDNKQIKDGLFQARYQKSKALASGLYRNDKRVGVWHFFDKQGTLTQNFDYDNNRLTYEAPDDSNFTYVIDKDFKQTDTVTKPIRIGGRCYGYIPYLLLFQKPADLLYYDRESISVTLELLISPAGNLADYTIHLSGFEYKNDLNVNINLLNAEDKIFVPATMNGEQIASRILVRCKMDNIGRLVL
ncbi:hypothetical protein GCM10028826_07190 [Mucilaginibacter boryungensis]